jgi:hypothetical protein
MKQQHHEVENTRGAVAAVAASGWQVPLSDFGKLQAVNQLRNGHQTGAGGQNIVGFFEFIVYTLHKPCTSEFDDWFHPSGETCG